MENELAVKRNQQKIKRIQEGQQKLMDSIAIFIEEGIQVMDLTDTYNAVQERIELHEKLIEEAME